MSLKKENENPYNIRCDSDLTTNASTECTGLIPSLSEGKDEWNRYREIFDFFPKSSAEDED